MTPSAVIVAMAVSLTLGGICRRLGRLMGVLDKPVADGLKIHTTVAVPLGGVGILVGLHAGLAIAGLLDSGLLLASLLIWPLGFLDDLTGLDPWARLFGATSASVLLVAYDALPMDLAAAAVSIVVIVVSINAINLLDGLDALAGSVAATALAGLAVLGHVHDAGEPEGMVIAMATLLGFLFWNLPPARLFLGNNGAYLVGLVLGWAAIQQAGDWWAGAVAVAAIGVPFIDLGITIMRRIRTRAPLFGGDRDHTYDRLHQKGWRVGRVAAVFSAMQAVWSTFVVTMAIVFGDSTAAIAALTLGAVVVAVVGLKRPSTSSTAT